MLLGCFGVGGPKGLRAKLQPAPIVAIVVVIVLLLLLLLLLRRRLRLSPHCAPVTEPHAAPAFCFGVGGPKGLLRHSSPTLFVRFAAGLKGLRLPRAEHAGERGGRNEFSFSSWLNPPCLEEEEEEEAHGL